GTEADRPPSHQQGFFPRGGHPATISAEHGEKRSRPAQAVQGHPDRLSAASSWMKTRAASTEQLGHGGWLAWARTSLSTFRVGARGSLGCFGLGETSFLTCIINTLSSS